MTKARRNIGREILDGLREIKRGDYGRVITIPSVTSIREKTGLSQARFAGYWASPCGPCRIGSKAAGPPRVRPEPC